MENNIKQSKKQITTLKLLSPNEFSYRFTDDDKMGPHDHDFFEIFYVTKGHATHNINGESYKIHVGSACLICPGIVHFYASEDQSKITHRDFLISVKNFKMVCDFMSKDLYDKILEKEYINFTVTDTDILFFENILSTFMSYVYNAANEAMSYCEKILITSLITFAFNNMQNSASTFKQKCLQLIIDNFSSPDAVDKIRNGFYFNKNYFCKKFKNEFGITLVEYINKFRIERAKNYVISTDYSIQEIASQVGIESIPYFLKLFNKYVGTTPSNYRKNQKNIVVHKNEN